MKAQLAEANKRIKKLSADVTEKRGGSYKHHLMEELHNIQDKVRREKAVMELQRENELRDVSIKRAFVEKQRKQLKKDQVHILSKRQLIIFWRGII